MNSWSRCWRPRCSDFRLPMILSWEIRKSCWILVNLGILQECLWEFLDDPDSSAGWKSKTAILTIVSQKFNCQIVVHSPKTKNQHTHQQRNHDLANSKDSFTKVCFNISKNMHWRNDPFAWSELRPIGQVHGGSACFWRTLFASACSSPVCKWPRIERHAVWQHHESTLIDGAESVSAQHGFIQGK